MLLLLRELVGIDWWSRRLQPGTHPRPVRAQVNVIWGDVCRHMLESDMYAEVTLPTLASKPVQ